MGSLGLLCVTSEHELTDEIARNLLVLLCRQEIGERLQSWGPFVPHPSCGADDLISDPFGNDPSPPDALVDLL